METFFTIVFGLNNKTDNAVPLTFLVRLRRLKKNDDLHLHTVWLSKNNNFKVDILNADAYISDLLTLTQL